MATVLSRTSWSLTSGVTTTVTIPSTTAGSTLIVTSGGGALVSAKITSALGTAFTKRTTYGGGDQEVAVQDFVALGGETAVFLTLNGAENVAGMVYEIAGLGAYIASSASSNGTGANAVLASDFMARPTATQISSGSGVLISMFTGSTTSTTTTFFQLGPFGAMDQGRIASGGGSTHFIWGSGISDVASTGAYPANAGAGFYAATTQDFAGDKAFACQAMYADATGVLTVPHVNPIVDENTLPGTRQENWYAGNTGTDSTIAGFANKTSYSPGDTVSFMVDSANTFRVEIYRLGYYGTDAIGARNVVGNQAYITGTPTTQPTPSVDSTTGATSCASWSASATWVIPSNAAPGVYVTLFRRTDAGNTTRFSVGHFIVKGSVTNKVAVVLPDFTYQAYNSWGATTDNGPRAGGTYTGRSLYELGVDANVAHRGYAVSFDRPYVVQQMRDNTYLFDSEQPWILFAEAQGYDLTYLSTHDLDANTSLLNDAKLAMLVGHHEYWTTNVYDCVTAAADTGVNIAFHSSNTALWHVRYDVADTARRTMICYKDSITVDDSAGFTGTGLDPVSYTGTWRDSRTGVSPFNSDVRRENALTGQLFTVNAGAADRKAVVRFADKGSPIWRNSASIQALTTGQTFTSTQLAVGDEVDSPDGSSGQPSNEVLLYNLTVTDFGSNGANAAGSTYTTALPSVMVGYTLYRRVSGALIFNTGSWRGSWGVSRWLKSAYNSGNTPDLDWQNAWLAIFYDLGVAPVTLKPLNVIDTAPTNPATGAPGPTRDDVAAAYGLTVPTNVAAAGSGSFRTDASGVALGNAIAAGSGKALLSAAAVTAIAVAAAGSGSLSGTAGGVANVISAAAGSASFTTTAAGQANVGQGNVGSASATFTAGGQAISVVAGTGSGQAGFTVAGTAASIQFLTGGAGSYRFSASGFATTGTVHPARDITVSLVLIPNRWQLTMGDDVPREIHTSLGAKEYVGLTITETTGKDISTDAVQLTLGTWSAPGTWRNPDDDNGLTPRVVKILVGDAYNPNAGEYYLWMKLPDTAEVVVRRYDPETILVD